MLKPAPSTEEEIFEREKERFTKRKAELLSDPSYQNKYVAIVGGEVVDSENDKSILIERVFKTYGYIPLYIGKVTKEPERCRRLPSPRRIR